MWQRADLFFGTHVFALRKRNECCLHRILVELEVLTYTNVFATCSYNV